ncbi:conserved hypothetical protein [Ricinus communis]|uniref:Uncharacterized protein n=1 Tax=Ricinus communis TaxID=3988 RepID=B9RPL6_RICCO|nr:conserved hypothetical protein [Ricinus communis]
MTCSLCHNKGHSMQGCSIRGQQSHEIPPVSSSACLFRVNTISDVSGIGLVYVSTVSRSGLKRRIRRGAGWGVRRGVGRGNLNIDPPMNAPTTIGTASGSAVKGYGTLTHSLQAKKTKYSYGFCVMDNGMMVENVY